MSNTAKTPPLALSDEQMSAVLAASYPLPPDRRSAFLEHVARGDSPKRAHARRWRSAPRGR